MGLCLCISNGSVLETNLKQRLLINVEPLKKEGRNTFYQRGQKMAPNENEIAKIREAICPPWEIAAHCVSKTKITFLK